MNICPFTIERVHDHLIVLDLVDLRPRVKREKCPTSHLLELFCIKGGPKNYQPCLIFFKAFFTALNKKEGNSPSAGEEETPTQRATYR